MRDLTRTRKQLVREMSQHSLRIQKVLEDANLNLGSVLSNVLGRSGRAMLDAIVAGETDPPGVSDLTASVIVVEIGVDMSRFPTAGHLISWAGLCPRSDESAGKRRSTRVRKSGTWIKTTLVTAAWSAVRVKTSYLRAQFLRIKVRRGAKKAILAVAASMFTAAFHMLRDGTEYDDLGSEHFDRLDRSKTIRRLLKRLEDLGCHVPALAHVS